MTKDSAFIRLTLAYWVAATTITACYGSQASTIPPGASFSDLKPATIHGHNSRRAATGNQDFVYVGNDAYNTRNIVIYPANVPNPAPIGTVTEGVYGPWGLA